MSYYVETNLTKNETVVCKAFVNKTALVPMILIAAVCLAIIFILNATVVATIYEAIKNSDSTTPDFVYAVFCVLFDIFPAMGIIAQLIAIAGLLSQEVAITNKRLIGKKGLINLKTIDIPISQISNATLNTSFFGRIFGYSTIEISSTGMKIVNGSSQALKLKWILNARLFLNAINDAMEKSAEQERNLQAEALAKKMSEN